MAKLKEFFNKVSNNNRIFTAEDIGDMSSKEFSENEKAIDYQMENLGIPKQNDLAGNSDVVYVHAYTKSDGTKVKSHYRSKSGGIISGTITGAAANADYSQLFYDPDGYMNKIPPNYTDPYFGIENSEYIDAKKNKTLLDIGVNIGGSILGQGDAVGMWNIASRPDHGKKYLSKNGKLYDSVNSLGSEYAPYKNKIKAKVESQFGKEDVQGVVLHENSSAARAINNSPELNNFINQNLTALNEGKEVTGSFGFTSTDNLYHAFGKVDILSAKKMDNGYVDVIILDTYDFNPGEKSRLVQMGYSAQEAGLLNPYFTIVKCRYKLEK